MNLVSPPVEKIRGSHDAPDIQEIWKNLSESKKKDQMFGTLCDANGTKPFASNPGLFVE